MPQSISKPPRAPEPPPRKTAKDALKDVVLGAKEPPPESARDIPGVTKKPISRKTLSDIGKELIFGAQESKEKYPLPHKKDGKTLEKSKTPPKKKLPYGGKKLFKRMHYKEWLGHSKRYNIYRSIDPRISKSQIIKRGEGLLPPRKGTGYGETWWIDKKLKDLGTQRYKAQTLKEKAEIGKDIELLKEYKKELETNSHN